MQPETFLEETPSIHLFIINEDDRLKTAWEFGLNTEQKKNYPLDTFSFELLISAEVISLDEYRQNLITNLDVEFRLLTQNVELRLKSIVDKIPIIRALEVRIRDARNYLQNFLIAKDSFETLPTKVLQLAYSAFEEALGSIAYETAQKEKEAWNDVFKEQINYFRFKEFMGRWEPSLSSVSFIYHKLLAVGHINYLSHHQFISWLKSNKFINKGLYESLMFSQLLSANKTQNIKKYSTEFDKIFP